MAEPQPLFDYTGHLPECPTWSEAEQALYWADILQCEIHRYDICGGEHQVLQFPEEVGCFALREKGASLWRYAALSGLPMPMACCGAKFVIIRATRSWHALTMAAPIATGAFMPVHSGAGRL